MMDLTGYELETLRDSGEFVLSRARQLGNPVPVLVLVAERPASASLKRLEQEPPTLIPSGRLGLWRLLDTMGTRRSCSRTAATSPSISF